MSTVLSYFQRLFPRANRYTGSGIDISGNQSANIVDVLLDQGHRFDWVVTKYTEGSSFYEDYAYTQRQQTLFAGLSHGCYHWLSYRTNPTMEYDNFIAHARRVGIPQPTANLPVTIWLDCEDPNYSRHVVSGYGYSAYSAELADRIEQTVQLPVGIYTGAYWANGRLDARCTKYSLWLAEYENGDQIWPDYTEPRIPNAWIGKLPMIWQWASVSIQMGHLDLNASDPSVPIDSAYARQFDTQRNDTPGYVNKIQSRPANLKENVDTMHVVQDDNNTLYLVRNDRKLLMTDALREIMPQSSITQNMPIDTANELFSAGLTPIPWVRIGYLALGVIPWEPCRDPNANDYWSDKD